MIVHESEKRFLFRLRNQIVPFFICFNGHKIWIMKKLHFILIFVFAAFFCSCDHKEENPELTDQGFKQAKINQGSQKLIIDQTKYNSSSIKGYLIKKGIIEGDSLKITVQYSGGCGTVEFSLLSNGIFMESYPVQLNVKLVLDDNDPCEKSIEKQISFDLSDLAKQYKSDYQAENGTIILHLLTYRQDLIYEF